MIKYCNTIIFKLNNGKKNEIYVYVKIWHILNDTYMYNGENIRRLLGLIA